MTTEQAETWSGEFGRLYTERNSFDSVDIFNQLYQQRYGRSRDEINIDWLKDIPRDARILEVGANVGYQLEALRRIGFRHLFGVEIQRHCVEQAKVLHPHVDIVEGIASDLPFKDGFFDLVFTNNVLIHMPPDHLPLVQAEMHRVTCRWVLGFEYYAPSVTEIPYHGKRNLLWKADYASLFRSLRSDLVPIRDEIVDCLDDIGKVDKFYLLEKRN
jgi:pseudaminic acid biosynthesis-associated methylase